MILLEGTDTGDIKGDTRSVGVHILVVMIVIIAILAIMVIIVIVTIMETIAITVQQ